MPATAPFRTTIMAHVPVDEIQIVNGPGVTRCLKIVDELTYESYVKQRFTLTTYASAQPFVRDLRIATIFDVQNDGSFTFTALFGENIVSGIYSPRTREGWFDLD
jgi:hypothetical protein